MSIIYGTLERLEAESTTRDEGEVVPVAADQAAAPTSANSTVIVKIGLVLIVAVAAAAFWLDTRHALSTPAWGRVAQVLSLIHI